MGTVLLMLILLLYISCFAICRVNAIIIILLTVGVDCFLLLMNVWNYFRAIAMWNRLNLSSCLFFHLLNVPPMSIGKPEVKISAARILDLSFYTAIYKQGKLLIKRLSTIVLHIYSDVEDIFTWIKMEIMYRLTWIQDVHPLP